MSASWWMLWEFAQPTSFPFIINFLNSPERTRKIFPFQKYFYFLSIAGSELGAKKYSFWGIFFSFKNIFIFYQLRARSSALKKYSFWGILFSLRGILFFYQGIHTVSRLKNVMDPPERTRKGIPLSKISPCFNHFPPASVQNPVFCTKIYIPT